MRLPIIATKTHLGKSLEVDSDRETLTLFGPGGEDLGTLPWEFIINQVLNTHKPVETTDHRSHPRVSLSFNIRYGTPEGNRFESIAGGIGIGGLFIESTSPLPSGTKVIMELSLPSQSQTWLTAKGEVAWVCPKADQYTFSPGMGVRFTELPQDTRTWILGLIKTHSEKSPAAN